MSEVKIEVKAKNIKGHKELDLEFTSPNVYLITGENDLGKTTILQILRTLLDVKSPNKNFLRTGTEEGNASGTITNARGEQFNIEYKVDNTGKEAFLLITADGKKTKAVTSIRDFIGYSTITPEEWFGWGLTAEGRRKQANFLLETQPKDFIDKIEAIDALINEKTGLLYIKRAEVNKEYETNLSVLNEIKISDDDNKLLLEKEAVIEGIKKLDLAILDINNIINKNNIDKEKLSGIDNTIKQQTENIKYYQEQIKIAQAKIEAANKEKEGLICLDDAAIESYNEKIKIYKDAKLRGLEKEKQISIIEANKSKYDIAYSKSLSLLNKKKDYDTQIETKRAERKVLFDNASLPERMVIINGECLYQDDNGETYPFTLDSISYRKGSEQIVELLLERNKHLPIIPLGNVAEWDNKGKLKLVELANKYNAIIVCDKVVENQENLIIKIIENNG